MKFIIIKDHNNKDIVINTKQIVTVKHNANEGNELSKVSLKVGNIYSTLTVSEINKLLK